MSLDSDRGPALGVILWLIRDFRVPNITAQSITTCWAFFVFVSKWHCPRWRCFLAIWECRSSRCNLAILRAELLCVTRVQIYVFSWKRGAQIRPTLAYLLGARSYSSGSIELYCLLSAYVEFQSSEICHTYCLCPNWRSWIWILRLACHHNLLSWHLTCWQWLSSYIWYCGLLFALLAGPSLTHSSCSGTLLLACLVSCLRSPKISCWQRDLDRKREYAILSGLKTFL